VQTTSQPGNAGKSRTVAVMQPYFFPYAGYFRLFAHVDQFVIFDCVQFRRRGRMHRTELPGSEGRVQWLTLPMAYSPRETLIRDVAFVDGARAIFDERLRPFDWIRNAPGEAAQTLRSHLYGPMGSFSDFLEQGLRLAAGLLDLDVKFSRSSELEISSDLAGQDRVLAILQRLGAAHYINLPGGRMLYDPAAFAQAGIQLTFLPDYNGPHMHMLHALMTSDLSVLRQDVVAEVSRSAS